MTITQERTLAALMELSRKTITGPTVGAVAFQSGQCYADTQHDLAALQERGLVMELPRERADSYARRYLPTAEGAMLDDDGKEGSGFYPFHAPESFNYIDKDHL